MSRRVLEPRRSPVRAHPYLLIATLSLLLAMPACTTQINTPATPEQVAYQRLKGTADTVDVAMKVWARYVVLNKLTAAQQQPVKDGHDRYRQAMRSAQNMITTLRTSPQPGGYDNVQAIVDTVANELIKQIYLYTE